MEDRQGRASPAAAPWFIHELRQATEAAARTALGTADRSDRAAGAAMRAALDRLSFRGLVVVGTGDEKDGRGLHPGAELGRGGSDAARYDLAVDPVEGTGYRAPGLTNAMALIAAAPQGALLDPGPCFYMEKFAAAGAAKDAIDPAASTEAKLRRLAEVLGKPVTKLKVFVLEKPRHNRLIGEVRALGAEAVLDPAGDVAGAVAAALGDGRIDALLGTGGAGEGILAACAVRAVGGTFWSRFDPQLATERARVRDAGLSTERWYRVEELVMSPEVLFCATGIATGLLVEGAERRADGWRTQTLMLDGMTGERQLLTTWLPHGAVQQEVAPCP